MATKKAGGSSKNGRKTAGKRLGVKIFGGQLAKEGAIIVRQRGTKFYCGKNTGLGRDHTIYSRVEGKVSFDKKEKSKVVVSVIPHDSTRIENIA